MSDISLAFSRDAIKKTLIGLINSNQGIISPEPIKINDNLKLKVDVLWQIPPDFELTFDDSPDAIRINEMDLVFHRLTFTFLLDIPTISIGGNCILRDLRGNCLLSLPRVNLFQSNPDFWFQSDLSGIVSEYSGEIDLNLVHFQIEDSDTLDLLARIYRENLISSLEDSDSEIPEAVINFLKDALLSGWELRMEPHWTDVDLLDLPDMIGNRIESDLNQAIIMFGSGLSSEVRATLNSISGGISDFIRALLDLPDDLDEFIVNQITSLEILKSALEDLSNRFGFLYLLKIPDKPSFNITENTPPIFIEIDDADINIEAEELTIELDISSPDISNL